jgi:hypothetical protein
MTLIIILGLIFILIVGFIDIIIDLISVKKQLDFFEEFRDKFIQLANYYHENNSVNNELYYWLTKNSSKAQSELGINGLMDYRPAFSNYMYKNYQFVVNTLPKFRTGEIHGTDISAMDDMLVRFIGIIEEWHDARIKKIKNPFIWFRIGMQLILSIPIHILYWLGIIGTRSKNRLIYNVIFKIFVGITSLVTLLSGIVTIIVGKDKFIEFVQNLINR